MRPTVPAQRSPRRMGDDALAQRCNARATALQIAFNRDFWLPDLGYFALALDRDKKPVDSLASNIGHCLWTGIVDEDKAAAGRRAATRSGDVHRLGSSHAGIVHGRVQPDELPQRSVWPHDNAIIAAGLTRYGFVKEAQQMSRGLIDAGGAFAGRLPELSAASIAATSMRRSPTQPPARRRRGPRRARCSCCVHCCVSTSRAGGRDLARSGAAPELADLRWKTSRWRAGGSRCRSAGARWR